MGLSIRIEAIPARIRILPARQPRSTQLCGIPSSIGRPPAAHRVGERTATPSLPGGTSGLLHCLLRNRLALSARCRALTISKLYRKYSRFSTSRTHKRASLFWAHGSAAAPLQLHFIYYVRRGLAGLARWQNAPKRPVERFPRLVTPKFMRGVDEPLALVLIGGAMSHV